MSKTNGLYNSYGPVLMEKIARGFRSALGGKTAFKTDFQRAFTRQGSGMSDDVIVFGETFEEHLQIFAEGICRITAKED